MKAKILIVDDSGLARRNTRRILEGDGYEVIEAQDGLGGLEQYFMEKPDVVVLDLVMKGMYGHDVLTKLREMDPEAKVIVVTADIQHSSRHLVEASGAAGFLTKPVQADQLLGAVRDALGAGH